MPSSIRDLKVWQEAVALASEVVRALRPANRREIKSVVEETLHSATVVATIIAEGYSCYEPSGQHERYTASRRELARLETHLAIARQAELLTPGSYQALGTRMQQVHRLLGGYLVYLDRQLAQPARSEPSHRPQEAAAGAAADAST